MTRVALLHDWDAFIRGVAVVLKRPNTWVLRDRNVSLEHFMASMDRYVQLLSLSELHGWIHGYFTTRTLGVSVEAAELYDTA